MLNDSTKPNWTARIALLAMVPAVVGGLWLFKDANHDKEPAAVVVSTGCDGFKADALKLFDKGETVALSGAFVPGDRVRLAIDFKGLGYSWDLTGVLATKNVELTGFKPYSSTFKHTTVTYDASDAITSIKSRGNIGGFARLEMDVDVRTAGEGALTIRKTGGVPSLVAPKVTSASCIASGEKSIRPTV
jgi:hypothetical protein